MPRYKVLDQIKWQGQRRPPGEVVTVSKEDTPIWDDLAQRKVAERLGRKKKETPAEPEESLPEPAEDTSSASG